MPFYIKQGKTPDKRHITFYKENGDLYREELFSTQGFSNNYSLKYHCNMPSKTLEIEKMQFDHGNNWDSELLQYIKFDSKETDKTGNYISARNKLMYNDDLVLYSAKVSEDFTDFYRNAYADEVIFVHEGTGVLKSEYGDIKVEKWDYLVIPKGTTYQLLFDSYENVRLFIIESFSMINIPKHFRGEYGQILEHAPYSERDFKTPLLQNAIEKKGEFPLIVKFKERYQKVYLEWHPFDLVGWDGFVYPYAFNLKNYDPVVGKIHLPPPVHLLFTANNFVICNFVPRLFDFHPQAIPAPYYHSNIDSDEVLYYVDGDFMSRTGIGPAYLTLHPMGLPHGPQPGKTEASVGVKEVYEYAIMVDTFRPLLLTEAVKLSMDKNYNKSWIE
jgi:homogentisate 1,2-dioxygenase